MDLITRNSTKAAVGLSAFVGTVFSSVAAFATAPYDLSGVTTGVSDQIQAALSIALPIMGGLLALSVGVRLVKRFVKSN